MIASSHDDQYKLVWNYAAELKRTHPESTIVVHEPFREQAKFSRFIRMYYCFGPLKEGF